MIALQRMLLQCEDDQIHLLPAWPSDWNVEYKLHAPKQTIVEGIYRNNQFESLTITPGHRQKDIILPHEQKG